MKIKRIDKSIPLPEYKTERAAAFDFYAREKTIVLAKGIGYVPLNNIIETPEGYFLMLSARSSTHKKGLILANGIGVVDPDFSGNGDEIKGVFYNLTDNDVVVEKGERVVQGMFIPIFRADWEEVDNMGNVDRGGFGSTG